MFPTNEVTLSDSMSFVASEPTCCGSVPCSSTMYSTGRPLMPPLSLAQSKYAFAASVMSVKSMPGIFVTIAPTLIGSPVAFSPDAIPHFASSGVVPPASLAAPPPPPLDELSSSLPQLASANDNTATIANSRSGISRPLTRPPRIPSEIRRLPHAALRGEPT